MTHTDKNYSHVMIIEPRSAWSWENIKDLWRYRELFYIFAWRDLKVRFKQTMFGALWAIFQPFFSMFVFTVFFGNIARISSGELPYSLFVLIGLVFWSFFSSVLTNASSAMLENENIIKKVYFPRMILPISKLVSGLVDFGIAFVMMLAVVVYLGKIPHINIVWLVPFGLVISSIGAIGVGLFLAAFNVKYRDVRYVLPFFLQMLVFFTPVIYPSTIVRPAFSNLMALNPMTAVIESVRASVAGSGSVNWEAMMISTLSSLVLLGVGYWYFYSTERSFVDIV